MPEAYGLIAIVNSLTQIFTVLMVLNFHGSLNRYYYEKDKDFAVFMGSISIFLIVYNILFVIFLCFFRDVIASFLDVDTKLLLFGIANGFLMIFSMLYLYYLQASQQSKKYAIINFSRTIAALLIAIVWVMILKKQQYLGRIYADLLVSCILLMYTGYNIVKLSKFSLDITKIKYALSYGIPLIPHALASLVLVQFDRLIINQISGPSEAGLYSFAYNVGMLMNLVVMSFNKSWVPIFYSKLNDSSHEDIHRIVTNYTKVIFLAALCIIFFSKEIVYILADASYREALSLIPIIVLGYVFVYFYTIYANYAFYRKKTYLISIFTIIASVLNIILNYIFISKYGYFAAAYTTLFSYCVLFILHFFNAKYILKESVPKLRLFAISAIIFIMLLVVYSKIDGLKLNLICEICIKILLLGIYIGYIVFSSKMKKQRVDI